MLRDDIEAAVRALKARPGFAALIVLCLAIGIGANIAMFSIANVLFLRSPAGVHNPDALVRLYIVRRTGQVLSPTGELPSYPDFLDVRNTRNTFTGLAAARREFLTVGHGFDAEQIEGEYVSLGYFNLLGAHTARGRFFAADEDSVRGMHPAVVLGYEYWQSRFKGRDVLGQTITVNGRPAPIVGVAERGFRGAGYHQIDMWLPVVEMQKVINLEPLQNRYLPFSVIGRRAPGVSDETVAQSVTAALTAAASAEPTLDPKPQAIARKYVDGINNDSAPHGTLILWLFGAVGFVLAIACANVANLLLVRSVQRRREIAVRLSLGVGRSRLARQALIESVILALTGAAIGLLLAWWSTTTWSIPGLARRPVTWDPTVVAFTLGLALVTAVAFGVGPAFTASNTSLTLLLKDGARSASPMRARGRSALIALQAALSLIVLAGAGLFVRSLQKMSAVNLGIDADHVVYVYPELPVGQVDSAGKEAILSRIVTRLAALPGVRAVSMEDIPRFRGIVTFDVKRPGSDSLPPGADANPPIINFVGPSYAEALGTPLILGRDITAADRKGSQLVTVVSQSMARLYWPGQNAIGQCLLISMSDDEHPTCTVVVGVVADAPLNIPYESLAFYYVPRAQRSLPFQPRIIVRTTGPAHASLLTLRNAVLETAPEVLYAEIMSVPMLLTDQFAPAKLGALLFTIFGVAALGLTAIGLYGIVAYLTAQRTREVGIRMALGSTALGAVALIARQGAKPVAIGLVAGLGGAFLVTRYLQHLLYNVSPTDGPSFAAAALVLGFVGAVACVLPARKAARVDPVVALRAE